MNRNRRVSLALQTITSGRPVDASVGHGMKFPLRIGGPLPLLGVSSSAVKTYLVTEVKEDYLVCRSVDIGDDGEQTIGDTDVEIAKPYDLRWSSYVMGLPSSPAPKTIGYYTYFTYTGSKNNDDKQLRFASHENNPDLWWEEEVAPRYVPNETVILATRCSNTITVLGQVSGSLAFTKKLTLVDVNGDGRRWDFLDSEISVCIGGTEYSARSRVSLLTELE